MGLMTTTETETVPKAKGTRAMGSLPHSCGGEKRRSRSTMGRRKLFDLFKSESVEARALEGKSISQVSQGMQLMLTSQILHFYEALCRS